MKQYMAKQIYPEEVVFLTHNPEDKFNKTTQHKWVAYPKDYLPGKDKICKIL